MVVAADVCCTCHVDDDDGYVVRSTPLESFPDPFRFAFWSNVVREFAQLLHLYKFNERDRKNLLVNFSAAFKAYFFIFFFIKFICEFLEIKMLRMIHFTVVIYHHAIANKLLLCMLQ